MLFEKKSSTHEQKPILCQPQNQAMAPARNRHTRQERADDAVLRDDNFWQVAFLVGVIPRGEGG